MHITYKFRVYPTKSQIKLIENQLEICRQVYNRTLKRKVEFYEKEKKNLRLFDVSKDLTLWKKTEPSYKLVHSQVLQVVQERVDLAFQGFFRRLRQAKPGQSFGFPKEKDPGRMRSLTYPQSGFRFLSKAIDLSKVGKIKAVFHRKIEGKISRLSLVKYPSGKFFVCVTADITPKIPVVELKKAVGIDLGMTNFAVLSNGLVEDSPKHLREAKHRLAARQAKGKSVALQHEKVSNKRSDFLHKLANKIVSQYDIISVEDLDVKRMQSKDKSFSKVFRAAIADAGWSTFINMLQYKAVIAGKRVVLVDPKFTSQECSQCGQRKKLELSDRTYYCERCGLNLCRDANAARNILRVGLAQLAMAGDTA